MVLPNADKTDSCIASDNVGWGKTVAIKSASVVSRLIATKTLNHLCNSWTNHVRPQKLPVVSSKMVFIIPSVSLIATATVCKQRETSYLDGTAEAHAPLTNTCDLGIAINAPRDALPFYRQGQFASNASAQIVPSWLAL